MMNLAMKAGMNQMKDQTQNLIESEMQVKNPDKKEQNIQNEENGPKENIEIKEAPKPAQSKKKKKPKISKNAAVRMYSVLLFHTGIITALLIIVRHKYEKEFEDREEDLGDYSWLVFLGCIVLSILLSLLVSKVQIISKICLNYIFYLVLLALNSLAFVWGGKDSLYDYILSMLIMFDAGSLTVLIFSTFVKDAPSTFWIMCSCASGLLVAMFVLIRVFDDHKYFVLLFCALSFAIYESMNYDAFDNCKSSVPSMISLPFELNLGFVKMVYYVLYGIFYFMRFCCCPASNKKKK